MSTVFDQILVKEYFRKWYFWVCKLIYFSILSELFANFRLQSVSLQNVWDHLTIFFIQNFFWTYPIWYIERIKIPIGTNNWDVETYRKSYKKPFFLLLCIVITTSMSICMNGTLKKSRPPIKLNRIEFWSHVLHLKALLC